MLPQKCAKSTKADKPCRCIDQQSFVVILDLETTSIIKWVILL